MTDESTVKTSIDSIRASGCRVVMLDRELITSISIQCPSGKVFSENQRHRFDATALAWKAEDHEENIKHALALVLGGFDDCPYDDCDTCADLATNEHQPSHD